MDVTFCNTAYLLRLPRAIITLLKNLGREYFEYLCGNINSFLINAINTTQHIYFWQRPMQSNSSLITHTQSFCDLVLPVAGTWYSSVEYHTINLLQYKLVLLTGKCALYSSVTLCGIETSSIYCMTYFYIALALCSHLCMYNVLRGVHIVKVRYK